jgi:putative phosphoesterase
MRIGVVSDTHGFVDPHLAQLLEGSEVILHAGDVGSERVLEELRQIAPVHAVRGNVDPPEANWPLSQTLSLGGVTIHILHILPVSQSGLEAWARPSADLPAAARRLRRAFDPGTEVVVFGHSHSPCLVQLEGVLWVNPGSAGKKRFSLPRSCALLEISRRHMEARVLPLGSYNGKLPERIRLKRVSHDTKEHQTGARAGGDSGRGGARDH